MKITNDDLICSGGGVSNSVITMRYKAHFEVPITFSVTVKGENLLVDKAELLLFEEAKNYLNKNYGHIFGIEFKKLKLVGTLSGGPDAEESK